MDLKHVILICSVLTLILTIIVLTKSSKSENYLSETQMSNANIVKVCKQQCNLISSNPIFGQQAEGQRCMQNCLNSAKSLDVLPAAWV
jgi:hypothetical protein